MFFALWKCRTGKKKRSIVSSSALLRDVIVSQTPTTLVLLRSCAAQWRAGQRAVFSSVDTILMYQHGTIAVTSPNVLDLVLVAKFKKVGENLFWIHTPADDQSGKSYFFSHWEAEFE